ncbi:restriction endonuclease subunit S [Vibrio anguillarum]|uniref:Restriction endonuclease subunit S n=1 Tax=Vibrio anguillarum TaxID=55601 RepID=A0ABD4QR16_VIBAN|nr:restriction endonuclease subunit S [Vibrio anguillarum]MBT2917657.1 restriction endonuclease subunit S [Vibrio anguillarum]
MSQLSYMERLLDGVEVEWIALREVVKTVTAPAKLKRESYRETGKTPIIDQGEKFITGYTDEDVKALPLGEYVIFGDHSEHIKYVDFSFIQGADGLKILKSISDNPKYVYYSFLNFYQKELNYKRHWARASETLIPIPCPDNPEKSLAIQTEIVRILDAFTAMTAELTAELSMRKKQYNYYRDQLLSFEEGDVEWKTLGEICESITSGKNKDKSETGKFPVYGSTGVIGRTNIKAYEIEQILVARVGANAGRVNIASGEYDVSDNTLILKIKTKYNLKFLYYYLVNLNLNRFVKGAGQPLLTAGQLKAMVIPVPTPEEQSRIVSILDNFDAITNSITEGLPREIELRQKQYEYYRDLLLSFPKSHSDEAA